MLHSFVLLSRIEYAHSTFYSAVRLSLLSRIYFFGVIIDQKPNQQCYFVHIENRRASIERDQHIIVVSQLWTILACCTLFSLCIQLYSNAQIMYYFHLPFDLTRLVCNGIPYVSFEFSQQMCLLALPIHSIMFHASI